MELQQLPLLYRHRRHVLCVHLADTFAGNCLCALQCLSGSNNDKHVVCVWVAIRNLVLLLICTDLPVNNHKPLCHLQATTLQSHLSRSQPSILPEGEETSDVLLWCIKTQEARYFADCKARAQGIPPIKSKDQKNPPPLNEETFSNTIFCSVLIR